MAFNLLDTVRGYLSSDIIDKASEQLGENSIGVNKAAKACVPALLGMFVNRAEKGEAQGLLHDAKEAANSNVLEKPESLFTAGTGSPLEVGKEKLRNLFGGSGIFSAIANFSGIRSSSAQGLMSILTPIGLGVLGRHAIQNNLTPQSLTSLLTSQKDNISSALPAGISLAGLPSFGKATEGITEGITKRKSILMPALLIVGLALIAAIWFWGRNETTVKGKTMVAPRPTTTVVVPAEKTPTGPVPVKLRLVNGVEINAFKGGVEDQLVACMNDDKCVAGKERWFDFDNINFQTGSSKLTESSSVQVKNIVEILRAYPNARIKIGGYTDAVGKAEDNLKLSQRRAEAVTTAIREGGANKAQLLGAEGYGSKFAKVPATASDEERKPDRRISISLRGK